MRAHSCRRYTPHAGAITLQRPDTRVQPLGWPDKRARDRESRDESKKVTYRLSVVSCCLRRDKPPLSARMCPGNRETGLVNLHETPRELNPITNLNLHRRSFSDVYIRTLESHGSKLPNAFHDNLYIVSRLRCLGRIFDGFHPRI